MPEQLNKKFRLILARESLTVAEALNDAVMQYVARYEANGL